MKTSIVKLPDLQVGDYILKFRMDGGKWLEVNSAINNKARYVDNPLIIIQTESGRDIWLRLDHNDEFEIIARPER